MLALEACGSCSQSLQTTAIRGPPSSSPEDGPGNFWSRACSGECMAPDRTALRAKGVFVLPQPWQEYIFGRRRIHVKLGIVLKKSLYLLTLHHPSRAEKGLSSSDCVHSLVTNLRAPCAPRGHFLHSRPGGLCDLISEQAILSNLLFLPISRELKVQIVDLILLRSSRTLLGLCCIHTAESQLCHHGFHPGWACPQGRHASLHPVMLPMAL